MMIGKSLNKAPLPHIDPCRLTLTWIAGFNKMISESHAYNINISSVARDENHPLLSLDKVEPHSMVLIIRPHNPRNNTVIRYMVPISTKPVLKLKSDCLNWSIDGLSSEA